MFSLSKRSAQMTGKAKADLQDADKGDGVTKVTVELQEIKLDSTEFNALLSEPHAWDCLFNTGANPIEPFLKGLKSLELSESIEGAYVRIDVGLSGYTRFDFKDCKLSKIKLDMRQGGVVAMSCKVQFAPDLDGKFATLFECLGHTVQIELRGESPGAQADLPLNTHEGDKDPTVSGLGRQIQAAAAREGRKAKRDAAKPKDAFN